MKKTLLYILLACVVCSCIYPFEAELQGLETDRLVVDGDILIGDIATIRLSRMRGLDGSGNELPSNYASVWVESSIQQKFMAEHKGSNAYQIDLRAAASDLSYRLHIKELSGDKEYVTPWSEVHRSPVIRDLKVTSDADNAYLQLSFDGSGSRYYKWDYHEVWEFHADFIPSVWFDPSSKSKSYPYIDIPTEEEAMVNYYCWASSDSRQPVLASTQGLRTDSVADDAFLSIRRTNRKLSIIYYIEVDLRAISRDGYDFLHTLDVNSNNTGSLFSPVPSDVRGNVRCVSDTTEIVLGFVEVTQSVKKDIYVHNSKSLLYKPNDGRYYNLFKPEPDEDGVIDYQGYYNMDNRPVGNVVSPLGTDFYWAPRRCVDCTADGGYKNKPAGWPNNHK